MSVEPPERTPFVTAPRTRSLLCSLAAVLALGTAGCSGGDSSPNEPAQEAGSGTAGTGGSGLEGSSGDDVQPAPGNQPLTDTGDDLEEPTEP
jgi:hypothetical protein